MNSHPYRQAFEARDLDGLLSLLADDVIVHSAVSAGSDFHGRGSAAAILAIVLDVFEDLECTHELGDERSHVLVYDARVLDEPIKTTWLLELDAEGKVREIWVMNRPLTALIGLTEALGRATERAGGGPAVREVAERLAALAVDLGPAVSRVVGDLNRATAQATP